MLKSVSDKYFFILLQEELRAKLPKYQVAEPPTPTPTTEAASGTASSTPSTGTPTTSTAQPVTSHSTPSEV